MKKLIVFMFSIVLLGSCAKQEQKKLQGLWTCQSINNGSVTEYFGLGSPMAYTLEFSDNLTWETKIWIEVQGIDSTYNGVVGGGVGDYTFDNNEIILNSIDSSQNIIDTFKFIDVILKRNELRFNIRFNDSLINEYYFTK